MLQEIDLDSSWKVAPLAKSPTGGSSATNCQLPPDAPTNASAGFKDEWGAVLATFLDVFPTQPDALANMAQIRRSLDNCVAPDMEYGRAVNHVYQLVINVPSLGEESIVGQEITPPLGGSDTTGLSPNLYIAAIRKGSHVVIVMMVVADPSDGNTTLTALTSTYLPKALNRLNTLP
jgi:hypothetical protein